MLKRTLTSLFFFCSALLGYEVRFEGVSDPAILELIHTSSQLEKLRDTPPPTASGLKRRAEGDLANIAQALQSLAYYHPKLSFEIDKERDLVIIKIDVGPMYPFGLFRIEFEDEKNLEIDLCELEIEIGTPALPEKIVDAEDLLLDKLNTEGYAFATIDKREVLVDQTAKNVQVILHVWRGPLVPFGPLVLTGLERVNKCFFYKRLRWCEGESYNPLSIQKYQEALELSGLFKSVHVAHADDLDEEGRLPIHVDVIEGKQRSIGFGVNYMTQFGPGVTAEWEDRNIAGGGEQLTFRADISQKIQQCKISYVLPEFRRSDQVFIWLADYQHEDIKAYSDSSFSLSGTIERQFNARTRFSYGGMYKLLTSTRSNNNRTFDLFKIPLQLRWSNADSLLNPTKGFTVNLKAIPSLQVLPPVFAYSINTFTGTYYKSLTGDDRAVFASKLMLGSIVGANKHDIPPPERFYAGSDNTIRGYKYLTISPLRHDDKPIGGRSLLVYSLEMRFRTGENLGWVAFYDAGNVYASTCPQPSEKVLQAVGVGVRYHTLVGPLRLDIAFPLNRRPHLDGPCQVYFSIGQAF